MDTIRRLNERVQEYGEGAVARYQAMSRGGKAAFLGFFGLNLFFFVGFWVTGPEKVFEQFARWADFIAASPYGWAILFGIIVVTSVPPLLGYGTAQTLVGFAYGVWPGFAISAASCLAGGAFAFLVVRHFIRYFAPFVHRDKTFQALSRAVRAKGLPLMVMLRLCPFPYPWSNAFFASIETVTLGQFLLATLAITPKLLLHVFVGHRTYLFADPDSRHAMDPLSKWLNGAFMVLGTVLGAGTSWYLYKLTMRYVAESADVDSAEELEAGLLDEVDGLLASAGGSADEGGPAAGRRSEAEEAWDERVSSDFGDEEGDRAPEQRRDSTAWGLDLDIAEEVDARGEEDVPQKGRLRLD
ncbi:Tlg2-vesicle protein [Rhodotorula kratochvilovae]